MCVLNATLWSSQCYVKVWAGKWLFLSAGNGGLISEITKMAPHCIVIATRLYCSESSWQLLERSNLLDEIFTLLFFILSNQKTLFVDVLLMFFVLYCFCFWHARQINFSFLLPSQVKFQPVSGNLYIYNTNYKMCLFLCDASCCSINVFNLRFMLFYLFIVTITQELQSFNERGNLGKQLFTLINPSDNLWKSA